MFYYVLGPPSGVSTSLVTTLYICPRSLGRLRSSGGRVTCCASVFPLLEVGLIYAIHVQVVSLYSLSLHINRFSAVSLCLLIKMLSTHHSINYACVCDPKRDNSRCRAVLSCGLPTNTASASTSACDRAAPELTDACTRFASAADGTKRNCGPAVLSLSTASAGACVSVAVSLVDTSSTNATPSSASS